MVENQPNEECVQHIEIVATDHPFGIEDAKSFDFLFADGGILDQKFKAMGWKDSNGNLLVKVRGKITYQVLSPRVKEVTFTYTKKD